MSTIGYREWEIWQNNRYFEQPDVIDGQYVISISLIEEILHELRVLTLGVDFPLTCNAIEFEIPPGQGDTGKVFVAWRMPFGRGMRFEVDERGTAATNLLHRSSDMLAISESAVLKAADH